MGRDDKRIVSFLFHPSRPTQLVLLLCSPFASDVGRVVYNKVASKYACTALGWRFFNAFTGHVFPVVFTGIRGDIFRFMFDSLRGGIAGCWSRFCQGKRHFSHRKRIVSSQGTFFIQAMEQFRRYEGLVSQCKTANGAADLAHVARTLPTPQGRGLVLKRPFVPPQPPPPPEPVDGVDGELQNVSFPRGNAQESFFFQFEVEKYLTEWTRENETWT